MKNKTWMKSLQKKGITAGLILAFCAVLSACGGQNGQAGAGKQTESQTGKQADAGEIGKKLAEALAFEDELTLADEDMAGMLYGIDTAVQSSVYISSGATAEEIAVFEFETEEDCKEAVSLAEQRIEDQKEAFASYVPKEVKRLDGADGEAVRAVFWLSASAMTAERRRICLRNCFSRGSRHGFQQHFIYLLLSPFDASALLRRPFAAQKPGASGNESGVLFLGRAGVRFHYAVFHYI